MLNTPLRSVYDRLYSGRVKRIVRALGLNDRLRHHWRRFEVYTSDPIRVGIGNNTADFRVSGWPEYKRYVELDERAVLEDITTELLDGDVFYDIGANTGLYSVFAGLSIGDGGTVASFEPSPTNTGRIIENCSLNGVRSEVYTLALGEETGLANLERTGMEIGHSGHLVAGDQKNETISTLMFDGDELISEFGISKPNVVKIDVDGAEMSILRGLQDTLTTKTRTIYCEIHPKFLQPRNESKEEVEGFIRDIGFTLEFRDYHGTPDENETYVGKFSR